jgi:3',5'-cyclic-AMP phosphodiesterase
MLSRPTIIAQIGDLHLTAPGELAYGRFDTAAILSRAVATLNGMVPRPDLVVIAGDLAQRDRPEGYATARQILAGLEIPFVLTCGNHDCRRVLRAAFPEQRFAGPERLDSVTAVGALDVFVLDSSIPGEAQGALDTAALDWLEAGLGRTADRPALLFLHHPPFPVGIWHVDGKAFEGVGRLAAIIRSHTRIRLVAAAHLHRMIVTAFAGIPAVVAPSLAHAVALDLHHGLPPSWSDAPPAFLLHAWLPEAERLVTHQVPLAETENGPLQPYFSTKARSTT